VYGAVDAVSNFNIATPPESWGGGGYPSPPQASYDDNLDSYSESQQQQQQARQRRITEQKTTRSAAMARLNLDEVRQQHLSTPTPTTHRVKSKQHTPESQ